MCQGLEGIDLGSREQQIKLGFARFWGAGRNWCVGWCKPGREPSAVDTHRSQGCPGGRTSMGLAEQLPTHQQKHQQQPAEIITPRGFEVWRQPKTKGNSRQGLLEHEKTNKRCGFPALFSFGSLKSSFATTGNRFLEIRGCCYSPPEQSWEHWAILARHLAGTTCPKDINYACNSTTIHSRNRWGKSHLPGTEPSSPLLAQPKLEYASPSR